MKKKILVVLFVIIVTVLGIILIRKMNKNGVEYSIEEIKEYNYLKYKENDKYGVIDVEGNVLIDAEYDNIEIPNPMKDVFICSKEGEEKNKALNSKNEELFIKYDNIETIKLKNIASSLYNEKSVLKYKKDDKYGIINFEGKEITKNIYESIENLQSTEGKILVKKDGKYGVININGVQLVSNDYEQIYTDEYYTESDKYSKSGFIVSNITDDGYRYGYVDYKGKIMLKPQYGEIVRICEYDEIYLMVANNGKYGLDKESKEIIKPEYEKIIVCENGALIVKKNMKYGIATLNGKIVLQPKYTEIEDKGIYLYAQVENKKEVYDVNGNKIDINFDKTLYNTENDKYKISTIINSDIIYYGVESEDGNEIIKPSYRYIEYLFNDYFIVKDEKGNFGIIDANGTETLEVKYDIVQKISNKNLVRVVNIKNKELQVYNKDLELIITMKDAQLTNEDDFIKIVSKDETKYFDNDGNEISEDGEVIKNAMKLVMPLKIGDYEKIYESLDNIYYMKNNTENAE